MVEIKAGQIQFFYIFFFSFTVKMTNTVSTTNPLLRLIQLTNNALNGHHLKNIQKIVFILVLFNYWSKLYNKVLIGGPVRAIQDFKAYLLKV